MALVADDPPALDDPFPRRAIVSDTLSFLIPSRLRQRGCRIRELSGRPDLPTGNRPSEPGGRPAMTCLSAAPARFGPSKRKAGSWARR